MSPIARAPSPLPSPSGRHALPVAIAHRGGAHEAPENTLAAFAHAAAAGVPWSETDITLSTDDVPLILHDDDLAHGTGRPPELASQLPAATCIARGVPTLEAALQVPGARYVLEIKACPDYARAVQRTWAAVCAAGAQPRAMLASLEVPALQAAREHAPEARRMGFIRDEAHLLQMLHDAQPVAVAVGPEWAAHARTLVPAHVALYAGLVNDDADLMRARQAGVHGLLTDRPRAYAAGPSSAAPAAERP